MINGNVSREHKLSITYSTIAAWITIVPAVWFIAKPVMTAAVAEELKEQIKQQMQKEVRPLSASFAVMLRRSIRELRREITALEFQMQEAREGRGSWTLEDAQNLADLRVELRSNEEALRALETDR